MPLNLRLYHSGVTGMKEMFDQKAKEHETSQLDNPFSEWDGGARQQGRKLSKDDDCYGRPLPGSKSESRALEAQYHIMMDIKYLCEMIFDCAEWRSKDGRAAMTFGKLFNLYNAVSDKLVGTLLRGRKHGFVHFDGEMLFQGRDDAKVIELSRNMNTIRKKFGLPPLVASGGEPEPWSQEEPQDQSKDQRRNSSPGTIIKTVVSQRRASMPVNKLEAKDLIESFDGNKISCSLVEECEETQNKSNV